MTTMAAPATATASVAWWFDCATFTPQAWDMFSITMLYAASSDPDPTVMGAIPWRGVQVSKLPTDLWIYQEILAATRPEIILEMGTHHGGSALYLFDVSRLLDLGARIVTVDLARHPALCPVPEIEYYVGWSSVDPELVAEFARQTQGKRTLVILDSDHTEAHVRAECEAYGPMVSPGSYLIVEDTHFDYGVRGPAVAARAFLAAHPEFERDEHCERFQVTLNRGGYLRRKP